MLACLLLGSGCSTTEEEVREQIEVLAANEVESPKWTAAADQLVTVGRPGARLLVELLDPANYRGEKYREFRDEITRTRTGAAVVLGRIKHKAASGSMQSRISTAYAYPERVACIRAIGELGFTDAAVSALKNLLETPDPDPEIRLLAAVSLIKMGEEGAVVDTVRRAVLADDEELALLAVEELEGVNYHGVSLLVSLAARSEQHADRLRTSLGKVKAELVSQLTDDDPEIRRESATALGDVGDASLIPQLLPLLEDSSNLVRFNTASSLSRLGSEEGMSFLFGSLADEDPILRVNATKSLTLVQRMSGEVEERLLKTLRSDSPRLRSGAVQILGDAKVARAVPQLIEATSDSDSQVRWNAVIALARIGSGQARSALQALLSDDDETVAYYAEWALLQLGAG
ncbi:MAG: HEAT repeat domain-containing protein [Candidatus Latescibacterota bacterium]|nr:HEAT repeat domain-containing protein [Candidatus Latescibacterota bacterium]